MRYFIDCEFDGHGGPLLSIAMVPEDGESIHVRAMDSALADDPWVRENVIPLLDKHEADHDISCFRDNIGSVLRRFMGDVESPTIIADSPVDIGRFCAAISTAPDGGWASADYPRMAFEVHNVDCYPTDLLGAVQHNAWWDAMALRHRLASAAGARSGETREAGLDPKDARAAREAGDAQPTEIKDQS